MEPKIHEHVGNELVRINDLVILNHMEIELNPYPSILEKSKRGSVTEHVFRKISRAWRCINFHMFLCFGFSIGVRAR